MRNIWKHTLVLVPRAYPNLPLAAFEVGSVQGNGVNLVTGEVLSDAVYRAAPGGLPYGALVTAEGTLLLAPDWTEEIRNALENETVLGKELTNA